MRLNENTIVCSQRILLVPYGKHHVKKYHTWMENEEMRELTASLPLTIEEEYQMQQAWLNDNDKLTFIILLKDVFNQTHDEIESMIGDVNLFLNDHDDKHCGEVELMIAETNQQHKGYGFETLCTFFRYVIENLEINRLIVKIGMKNEASINLFTKKFQFQIIETSEIFQEITMIKHVDKQFIDFLQIHTSIYKIDCYDKKSIKDY